MTTVKEVRSGDEPVEAPRRYLVPLIIRGTVYEDHPLEHPTRRGGITFATPDVHEHLPELPLANGSLMADLYELSFDDIVNYLSELGSRLSLASNPYLHEAFELSCVTSGLTRPVLETAYTRLAGSFAPDRVREVVDAIIGVQYVDGWVPTRLRDGREFSVRAFGPRMVQVLSGNLPGGSRSMIFAASIRADIIMKPPSNDPASAAAIVRTMCDMAPDHPITRHTSVAYWRGGDTVVEDFLYHPARIEKIQATGGEESMQHIRKYMRPGLDLVFGDPKLSATIVGAGAIEDDATLRDVAARIARDVGVFNQEACCAARVVYVETGTNPDGLDKLRALGRMVLEEIRALPESLSSPINEFSIDLRDALDGLQFAPGSAETIMGDGDEGGVVLSLTDEPVEFADLLSCRVANLVPVDSLERAVGFISNYTQTIGVYPATLKHELRDRMSILGAQRFVTLGHANDFTFATPADGMEPLRRLAKWIVDEESPAT